MVPKGRLDWCKRKAKGIKIIKPNPILSESYLRAAQETMLALRKVMPKSRIWSATMKYYCEYFLACSILARIGIKSELHECTIEIIRVLHQEKLLSFGFAVALESDKRVRIDNQYYLKNMSVKIDYNELTDLISDVWALNTSISRNKVEEMRSMIISS